MVRTALATINSILYAIGLLNFLIIFVLILNRRLLKSVTNIYILNLCIADALCISILPVVVINYVFFWIFGTEICKIFYVAEQTNKYASILFLSILSFDRFFAICRPLDLASKSFRSPKIAIGICAGIWGGVAILLIPIFLFATVVEFSPGVKFCLIVWPKFENSTNFFANFEKNFLIGSIFAFFVVPVGFICVCTCLTIRRLFELSKLSVRRGHQQTDARYRKVAVAMRWHSIFSSYLGC